MSWSVKRNLIVIFLFSSFTVSISVRAQNLVSDQVEFQALKDLWDGTAGSAWTNKTGWPTSGAWPSTATAAQMDAWFGIVVTNGDITELQLSGNNLTGTLPPSLANLTQLKVININGGKLSGSIPTRLGNMTQLTFLRLDQNLFSGVIPTELSNLTTLQTLGLGYNTSLTGSFPDFSPLTAMVGFSFANCSGLTAGPIPSWIFSMPNLSGINFNGTHRTGVIPDLSSLTRLTSLGLQGNSLTGPFPVSLTQCNLMQTMDISNNQLSGELPLQIGNMTALTTLAISVNKFTGSIPDEINSLHNLQYFNAYQNQFTGFPMDVTGLTSMIIIDITTNQISTGLPVFATISRPSQKYVSTTINSLGRFPRRMDHFPTCKGFLSMTTRSQALFPSNSRP